ncbi:helix-turn-helix transcriptional regulator [Branchiibius sp. NY16-3462-2]|uniref:helix-turn-helix domain-containing protein n=1 Tax=Branchiibius sp. NY16-3462-2 TaxID=1807500 RepID=UPI00079632B2|nr:helix-turn-helix transcriptional regulator [Branchiibius sp. NY16-3462-2]KYH43668.1 hypothetical protein AZH51_02335 [Branchiibius sp. NY16-3462-2]
MTDETRDFDDLHFEAGSRDMNTISAGVKHARQEKRWSQERLAKEMANAGFGHWRQTTVSRVENGTQGLSMGEVGALDDLLGTSLWAATQSYANLRETARQAGRRVTAVHLRRAEELLEAAMQEIQQLRNFYERPQEGSAEKIDFRQPPANRSGRGSDIFEDIDHAE